MTMAIVVARALQLLQADVRDEAEPESLQEMEDEALLAVEEPEQDHVAVEEIGPGTHVERGAVVRRLHPQRALVRRAEEARLELPPDPAFAPLELVAREGVGVAQVLLEVEQDRPLLEVLLLE